MLLGGGHGGTGRVDLGLGREIGGAGVIEFLLGDETWVTLSGLLQANVLLVECLVLGLGTTDLVLRSGDLFLALVNLEDRLLELGLEFGDFERSECLAFVDDVADIDVDLAHVAGDLGVHVHDLVRLKLAGEGEDMANIATLGDGDAGGGYGGGAGVATVVPLGTAGAEMDDGDGRNDNRYTGGDNLGCSSSVIRMHCEAYS
jgi:hypothetical protein